MTRRLCLIWVEILHNCRENGCILLGRVETWTVRDWEMKETSAEKPMNAPSPLWCKYSEGFSFPFKKKSIYSGCVCCLASLDRIHTASVEIQNPSRFSFHTHTHCCFKLLTLQSTHALQESQKRGDILLYTHTKYHFSGFSAACTTLQFAASYAFMSTVNTDTL